MVILATLLGALFASALSAIPRWGATDEEIVLALPGDELAPQPLIHWTNAIDVNAPPADVWPWIAQLGDTRGGFYSYTFIQPDIWVRVLVNAALLFGVWWADHPATQSSPALRAQPFAR